MKEVPRLSVLDAAPIGPGVTASQALQWTTKITQVAESLGYHRLWVVEHHGTPDIGCSAPAVMIAHLASATQRLRLGSGGVMLPNHAPLVVAEEFSMLQGLYPGRIDLGVGRAISTDQITSIALRRGPDRYEEFVKQLDELDGFLYGGFPEGHSYENVRISLEVNPPPIYLLGSSGSSAHLAASRGMPFAFAHHLNPEATNSALAAYRTEFQSSGALKEPYAIVTVSVVCAPTQEEAVHAALGAAIIRVRRALSIQHGLGVSDEALRYPRWSAEERQVAEKELSGGWILVGGPNEIAMGLMELQQATGADELMLTTIEYEGPDRIRTLQAVSDAVRLADQMAV